MGGLSARTCKSEKMDHRLRDYCLQQFLKCIKQPAVALEGVVALVAEGCAVVARAPALLRNVQIPLAVEGDPVLRPRRLVAPLARHLIKGSRWYLLHCLATQDLTPERERN